MVDTQIITSACEKCLGFIENEKEEDNLTEEVEFIALIIALKEPERAPSNKAYRLYQKAFFLPFFLG